MFGDVVFVVVVIMVGLCFWLVGYDLLIIDVVDVLVVYLGMFLFMLVVVNFVYILYILGIIGEFKGVGIIYCNVIRLFVLLLVCLLVV